MFYQGGRMGYPACNSHTVVDRSIVMGDVMVSFYIFIHFYRSNQKEASIVKKTFMLWSGPALIRFIRTYRNDIAHNQIDL